MSRREPIQDSQRDEGLRLAKIRFMEEWEGGTRPTVRQFAARYPDVAEEITDFILAFVATERAVATVSEAEQPSELSERAIRRAAARYRQSASAAGPAAAKTLLELAKASGTSMLELVLRLDLSNQAVLRIIRGQVLGVPRYLVSLLAGAFGRSEQEVAVLVSLPLPRQALLGGHHRASGEEPLDAPPLDQVTFEELLEQCSDLTEKQRQYWQQIAESERAGGGDLAMGSTS